MRLLLLAAVAIFLQACATPKTWEDGIPVDQLQLLNESAKKFERIAVCSKASKEDEDKFQSNCALLFSNDTLTMRVRKVYVHGFKYAIEGDLSETKSLTCEVTLDRKMTEEKLKRIEPEQSLTITGPISNFLKTSQNQTAKVAPCQILTDL